MAVGDQAPGNSGDRTALIQIVRAISDIVTALGESSATLVLIETALDGLEAGLTSVVTAIQALQPGNLPSSTVAALPAAGTAGAGAHRLVTDANATTFASVVAGGGANVVPVYSDGAAWRIG